VKWVIVILMAGYFSADQKDAVEVETYNGSPLWFETVAQCKEHIETHSVSLRQFARRIFPDRKVKMMTCFRKTEI
tara:strand:- start:822 stop:1046 length:225 start_codon:yes stop_codon:yes gene_type:complete